MKQILQHLNTGLIEVAEVPCPAGSSSRLRIRTSRSLISAGTERMLVEFSQANLIQKARCQPDKVRQVLDKIKTDGLLPTLETVFRKLDEPLALGYCNVGVVLDTGRGLAEGDIGPGDRMVSNGPHAEIVSVPCNLCAKIPDGVSDEEAVFAVVGAIALQGIRLAAPTLGERFMVTGLGLIGLLTVQLLRAHGCEVLGVDLDEGRLKLARDFGAATVNPASQPDVVSVAQVWSRGVGVDAVIVTASAKTDEVMRQAAQACRKRGRIVLVGVVGLNLRRDDFYKKELSFQVSCSYGPGRHDESYEQDGQDYPLPYVRWTEQRNFEAVLGAMQSGAIDIKPLITHRFSIGEALLAYETIQKDPTALGVILEYPSKANLSTRLRVSPHACPSVTGVPAGRNRPVVGVIGAGNFARAVLLPALAKTQARLRCIAARTPAVLAHAARKFRFEEVASDHRAILDDPEVGVVFIATGHDTHARLVCEALAAGKHVFVEKPLCLKESELAEVRAAYQASAGASGRATRLLMVGFNRRFSAHTAWIKNLLAGRTEPLCMTMTVNAGAVPADHWVQDAARGGGRIIGEACHFIDLLSYVAGAAVTEVSSAMVGQGPTVRTDKMCLQLSFSDGSIGTVNYFANGSKSYPKETLEVFSEGRIARLENFRVTRGYGFGGLRRFKTWRQDKGHDKEIAAFIERVVQGGKPLAPFVELENVTRASFGAMESAVKGGIVRL